MAMIRALSAPALVLVLASCRVSAPPPPARPQLHASAQRVVLLSLDGLQSTRHRRLLAAGAYEDPAGLAAFAGWGYVVERATPVDPPLTAVSHASIATGAFPARTGIVSNRFHLPGTAIDAAVSGFDAPLAAEPIWEAFERQGKRVGSLTYPGCDGRGEARRVAFGTTYVNDAFAPARTLTLRAADFAAAPAPPSAPVATFGGCRRATVEVALAGEGLPASAVFTLTAVDTVDDGVAGFDTLLADADADPGNGVLAAVKVGEWFPLRFVTGHEDGGRRTVGAWCLLQRLPADLDGVRIYRGAFHATAAYPRSFRERLEEEAGFWPGPPDDDAVWRGADGKDGLLLADYLAQLRRFSEYFAACARSAVAHEPFDLLLAYQPVVDEAQHAFTIVDPRQAHFSDGLTATAAMVVDESYGAVDRAVGDLARAVDLSRTAMVVVSDHGIAPVWQTVHLNEVLRAAGLAEASQAGDGRRKPSPASRVLAVASGGCAHFWVNLEGREATGVVPPAQRDELVQRTAQLLALVEVDGEPVAEEAYRREELAALGLDSVNSGDLVVFMKPGFNATGNIGGPPHEPAWFAGQHGFRSSHEEMHGVWLARGAAVPRSRRSQASLTEVAAFVASIAGVSPPAQAQPWAR